MIDQYGRAIDYMRISITDRCNLRCTYCMPNGIKMERHADILTYEELLRLCRAAVSLGVVKFKVTGGEPLVRRGCTEFVGRLKALPGVEQVTLTTNGLLLAHHLDALCAAGIDGVNISLDTLREASYAALTGFSGEAVPTVRRALEQCAARGLHVKVNTVLLAENFGELPAVAALAQELPVDVRFIELMPIGKGAGRKGVPMKAALERLTERWPDLHPTSEKRGNGPARYYAARGLQGRIGLIGAMSHEFCGHCNRVRLTATGALKPCLCYEAGTDLRALLRTGHTDEAIRGAMGACIAAKPAAHCFSLLQRVTERRAMSQIGG